MTTRKANWKGMNWIRQEKRLAIYLRDGMACVYCGHSVEEGASLSLDHLRPESKGGSNCETNLVTCCSRCNSARGNRSWKAFAASVAKYLNHGIKPEQIVKHVQQTSKHSLKKHLAEAKELVARRGSVAAVLANR